MPTGGKDEIVGGSCDGTWKVTFVRADGSELDEAETFAHLQELNFYHHPQEVESSFYFER